MSTITYIYQGVNPPLTYTVDYSGESGKIVLENNPFQIENKKVEGYKTNPNNTSYNYYPLQLIDVPTNNITLYTTVVDAGLVQVENEGLPTKDISGMVLNVVQKKGKNQPFSYVVLTLSRQLFIDADVTMIQKQTKFNLNIYGITGKWIYERLEDSGSYYDITLVNSAYYLKNITLLSLLNFTVSGSPTASTNTITLTNLGVTSTISWNDKEGSFPITFDSKTLTIKIKRNTYTVGNADKTDYSLTKISNCNPDDLFYFLAKYVAGYTSAQIDISPGFYYNVPSLTTISDTYTTQEIENLKNGAKNTITNQPLLTSVSLRLDEFCWDILQSLAYLSNREIIFDDKAYFKPFSPTEDVLSIDWEPPTDPIEGVTYITTMALSENDDQGSQYLTASQKVVSEAYETTVAISDTTSSYVGQDIKYLAVDDTGSDDENPNSKRNAQAKIVALNALIKNFKPGDCIEYSVNETTVPNNNGAVITNWNQFNTVQNKDCFLFKTTLPGTNIVAIETYYVKKNNIWYEYDTDNPLRETGYDVNTCVSSITDAHNNISLSNVALALKTVEYPACVTTYTWGNPQFMDEQSQFNDLAAVSQDTVLDNTSDTGISSGDATKLVVGNQYVHQLRDDRAGFTGLIMEKNLDNDVFRLVGYNQGVVQAQFNSEGKIEAGAGVAQLDEDGLTVYYNSANYVESDALKFKNKDNPQIVPYRLFATYDTQNRLTKSSVQAISQRINNEDYTATLEMMCNSGGATNTPVAFIYTGTNPISLANNQTIDLVTGISTHSVMIVAKQSAVIDGLEIILTQSDNNTQTETFNYTNTAKVTSIYPKTFTKISYKNISGETMSIDMDQWSISYIQTNGDGASFTLSSSGTEVKGDTKIAGNFIQTGGTVEFNGPDDGGVFSAASPAIFKMPVMSSYQLVAPFVIGQASITSPQVLATNVTASGKIDTGYTTLKDFACRRIQISDDGEYSGTPQAGDILLII